KGRLASMMHEMSARAAGPFLDASCAGPRPEVLDAELFGRTHTLAGEGRPEAGLVEMADGGTLFLDEIARLDPQLQPKLVKLLDAGVLRQAGDAREVSVDVRLIAATSTDLVDAVNAGRFREDLYYR